MSNQGGMALPESGKIPVKSKTVPKKERYSMPVNGKMGAMRLTSLLWPGHL